MIKEKIMIHQYQLGGYNIVLDVCSGAVHVVDEVAYDIIAMFEESSRERILAAMAEKYAGSADEANLLDGGKYELHKRKNP